MGQTQYLYGVPNNRSPRFPRLLC